MNAKEIKAKKVRIRKRASDRFRQVARLSFATKSKAQNGPHEWKKKKNKKRRRHRFKFVLPNLGKLKTHFPF